MSSPTQLILRFLPQVSHTTQKSTQALNGSKPFSHCNSHLDHIKFSTQYLYVGFFPLISTGQLVQTSEGRDSVMPIK